ncbi:hypothetical protein EON63_13140 [archaeon]|nr:MAG: hypothetical protein EON63_13140 [archaeon]
MRFAVSPCSYPYTLTYILTYILTCSKPTLNIQQVVHYQDGQRYDSHHDWGVSGYPESRYITLLLYLSDMPSEQAGGETSFPKAAGGMGIKVHPGSLVCGYSLYGWIWVMGMCMSCGTVRLYCGYCCVLSSIILSMSH